MNFEIKLLCNGLILGSNCYLVKNNINPKKSFIVDASRKKYVKHILEEIKNNGLTYDDISMIVITHSHYDHTEGLKDLKKTLKNAKVIIHKSEGNDLKNGNYDMPNGSVFYTKLASLVGGYIKNKLQWFRFEGVEPDILVGDRYKLDGFDENCYILHTPGHSKGSISIILNESAIVGDLMYNRKIAPYRKYASFNDDLDMVYKQWKKFIKLKLKKFYPGHGDCIQSDVINKSFI